MQTLPYWIPFAVAATLMGTVVVPAQNWQTVDDFALAGGDAEAHGVAVDAAGMIYVVGNANGHGIVRSSCDGGTNWVTQDDFVYPSVPNNVFNTVTITPHGDLFVGGSSGLHWIVRRSRNQGVSWETVDDYYRPMIDPSHPGTNGVVYSLSSDSQGRVYAAGLMWLTGPSYDYWWVRGSDISGTNWDTKLVKSSIYGDVAQITCANEDVYVTGSIVLDPPNFGLILRSSNHGASWSTVSDTTNEFYDTITADSAGNIYCAGNSRNSNLVDWLVRKAAPGSTDWTIIDRSTYSISNGNGDQANPHSIAVDAAGNICVAGQFVKSYFYETNGHGGAYWTWFTRQYSAATGEWNTTDLFSYSTNSTSSTNTHAIANGTAIAPDGSTFVVGYGTSDLGQHRWIVRKESPFTPPARLQIALANRSLTVSWPAANTNSILQWTDFMGVNKAWQNFTGMVCVTNGQYTATLELAPGARFFRLKSTAGQ
jgi:hypothetical protein